MNDPWNFRKKELRFLGRRTISPTKGGRFKSLVDFRNSELKRLMIENSSILHLTRSFLLIIFVHLLPANKIAQNQRIKNGATSGSVTKPQNNGISKEKESLDGLSIIQPPCSREFLRSIFSRTILRTSWQKKPVRKKLRALYCSRLSWYDLWCRRFAGFVSN